MGWLEVADKVLGKIGIAVWPDCQGLMLRNLVVCLEPLLNGVSRFHCSALKAANFIETTMQVDDLLRAGSLVESVNILRDHAGQHASLFQLSQYVMRGIGLSCGDSRPAQH